MANSMGIGFRGPSDKTVDIMTKKKDSICVLHFSSSCLSIRARRTVKEKGKNLIV